MDASILPYATLSILLYQCVDSEIQQALNAITATKWVELCEYLLTKYGKSERQV